MKCVVTDYVEPELDYETAEYAAAGITFAHFQMKKATSAELIQVSSDADVLIVDQATISADVLRGAARCALVIRHGDGYDNVDLSAATDLGIAVANKPGFWSREVAEQALVLGLTMFRRLPEQQRVAAGRGDLGGGTWRLKDVFPIMRIGEATLGIVGFGRIGSTLCSIAQGVYRSVVVYDPYVDPASVERCGGVPASWTQLLAESDVVSLHVPLTDQTRGIMNDRAFAAMKRSPVVVNTARGPVVETEALVRALERGLVRAAALDTTDPEPLQPDHALYASPRVIVTPHLGWYSEQAMDSMRRSIVRDVINLRAGILPDSVVNRSVLDSPALRAAR